MKRICFGLLLLCAVGFLACENQPNNNNATPNANGSASPTASTQGSPTISASPSPSNEVPITIIISNNTNGGRGDPPVAVTSISPDPANLEGGEIALWTIENDTTVREGVNMGVEIHSFKGDAGGTTPFGPKPVQNDFVIDLLQQGTIRPDPSNPARPNLRDTQYKYTISLSKEDGTPMGGVDPQIIVGIRPITPTGTPSPTATASPSPTPARKK